MTQRPQKVPENVFNKDSEVNFPILRWGRTTKVKIMSWDKQKGRKFIQKLSHFIPDLSKLINSGFD